MLIKPLHEQAKCMTQSTLGQLLQRWMQGFIVRSEKL